MTEEQQSLSSAKMLQLAFFLETDSNSSPYKQILWTRLPIKKKIYIYKKVTTQARDLVISTFSVTKTGQEDEQREMQFVTLTKIIKMLGTG